MAQSRYRKERRFFAQQNRAAFLRVTGSFHQYFGNMPNVYNTRAGEHWMPAHYAPVYNRLSWGLARPEAAKRIDFISREWWLGLDPYAEHILVMADMDDGLTTLCNWLLEVHPHEALLLYEPTVQEMLWRARAQ